MGSDPPEDQGSTVLGTPAGGPEAVAAATVLDDTPPVVVDVPVLLDELPAAAGARYESAAEVGRGGMGVVLVARDALFGREVALKQLLDPESAALRARFLDEARVTAQLEHPNVVPVHDLGVLPDGQVFFAMKLVRGQTLADILDALEAGDVRVRAEFGRVRLLTLFQQVCMGVHYAHSRGVVHRDLKPENIMVGEYGEVHVMDWGVARSLAAKEAEPVVGDGPVPRGRPVTLDSPPSSVQTAHGVVVGTPSYMPPEQARGEHEQIGPHSDVYALGAMLYEILSGQPPFLGTTPIATLIEVVDGRLVPPRERAPGRDIPPELEDLSLRALAREPSERPGSARDLYDEIEAFLEGRREAERRALAADRLVAEGEAALEAAGRSREQTESLAGELERLETTVAPEAPVEDKRPLWALQDHLETLATRRDHQVEEAVRAFSEAVRQVPLHGRARRVLADHYWERLADAEDRGDLAGRLHYRSLVQQYNDGAYDALLRGVCPVEVVSDPAGVRARLHPLVERDRRLVPGAPKDLGRTPTEPVEVTRGPYLLVLEAEGRGTVRRPVRVGRGDHVRVEVRRFPPSVIGEGFVHVPAGACVLGGDPDAPGGQRPRHVVVVDYALAVHPVTCGEYVEFLNALIDAGRGDEARRRAPREHGGTGHYWEPAADGRFAVPITDRDGDVWDPAWPVSGVSYRDACAFCVWRSGAGGAAVRLPTADEWEKAARGVDRRFFPWGNQFDPTFCKMRLSRGGRRTPEPVGSFPADTSVYGVMDLAGGVREWTSTQMEGEDLRALKGGAWNLDAMLCRAAAVFGHSERWASTAAGFRLAKDLA